MAIPQTFSTRSRPMTTNGGAAPRQEIALAQPTAADVLERIIIHDGNRDNNRIANLRLATSTQNAANRRAASTNTSGFKGVVRRHRKWRAQIKRCGRFVHLGLFDTPEEAAAAYAKAAAGTDGAFFNSKLL